MQTLLFRSQQKMYKMILDYFSYTRKQGSHPRLPRKCQKDAGANLKEFSLAKMDNLNIKKKKTNVCNELNKIKEVKIRLCIMTAKILH